MTTKLIVDDMGCSGCEDIVENALSDVAGVEDADADEAARTVAVEGDAAPEELVAAVAFAGYEVSLAE